MTPSMRSGTRRQGLAPLFAVLLMGAALAPRQLHADASGCSRVSNGRPHQESLNLPPDCDLPGSGCYQCAYDNANQSGYTLCAENPSGSGALCGDFSAIPPDWPEPDPGIEDPNPGELPPDAPPPDAPPGAGGGSGGCDSSIFHDCFDGIVTPAMSPLAPPIKPLGVALSTDGRESWTSHSHGTINGVNRDLSGLRQNPADSANEHGPIAPKGHGEGRGWLQRRVS